MHIIMGSEAAEKLKENYTVLELETFEHNGQKITAYCVVNEVPLGELPDLEKLKALHQSFIDALNQKNYAVCEVLSEKLKGRFNGELDTFYEEIDRRIKA